MSADVPVWDRRYPDESSLRREIAAVTEAFLEALFGSFPRRTIAGVYAKGSARKPWDSPLDYVPELSDVDFHVLFADDRPDAKHFPSIESALAMQRVLDEGYTRRIPLPIHVPRVQLIVANDLHRMPDFIHSVPHTVEVLFGRPYPAPELDPEKSLSAGRHNLRSHESYLQELPGHVADKTGRHLWELLRWMNWRIGAAGPPMLE